MLRVLRLGLAGAFALAMATLLVWNVEIARSNQELYGPDETPRVHSSNIATMAALNPMKVVRYAFSTFYRLRMLAGKTLVVPAHLASYQFFFERVSRLHVEVVPALPVLSLAAMARVDGEVAKWFALDEVSPLGVVTGGASGRYLLAERAGGGLFVILPEPVFWQQVATDRAAEAMTP